MEKEERLFGVHIFLSGGLSSRGSRLRVVYPSTTPQVEVTQVVEFHRPKVREDLV